MTTSLILIAITSFFAISLMVYYIFLFGKLARHSQKTEINREPVSVIIAARNEKRNLENFLPRILEQDYTEFEVIVINDGSYDGTTELLEEMEAKFSHLRVVDLHLQEQYQKGKKFALTMGIKAAKYERLLFTDADCEVPGKFWIRDMLSHTEDKDIVLGYAPIKAKHNPLGAIVFYETFHTALQYLSYALNGLTYMGVGRNLSYKKQLFFRNKGFASHQHLLSGDDDLFIQEVASRDNVAICITPETFMESVAPKNFSSWIRQKQRHTSTADLYKAKFKWLLAYYSFAQILFYLCIALNIFFPDNWYIAGGILLLKWLVQWTIFYKPALKLNAKRIAIFLPFYDFYYTGYLLLLGLVKPFYRGKTWM